MANQLDSYINKEGLSNLNQSAYKRLYSTETALLKIQNDIAALMDSGKAVALTLLDLSAAFDAIDHTILFHISQIVDRRLNWVMASRMPSHFLMGPSRFCPGSTAFYTLHYPPQSYNF